MNYNLKKSYEICIDIIKKESKSFYKAFSILPKNRFLAVAAIYSFCRIADDIVNESEKLKEYSNRKLKNLEYEISYYFKFNKIPFISNYKDIWSALSDTIEKYNIPIDGFLLQIQGQNQDLFFEDITNLNSLISYSRLVGGSVGLLLMPILVNNNSLTICDSQSLEKSCSDLGVAMQITNILRDVGEDIRDRNRVYLPSDLMRKFNISRKEISDWANSESSFLPPLKFKKLWNFLAGIADSYYLGMNNKIDFFCRKQNYLYYLQP